MALEYGKEKPIFEILNVDPKNYPSPESLSERQVKQKFKELKRKLEKNSFVLEFSEKLPVLEAYRYLAGVKYDSWTDEEIRKERERRHRESIRSS